MSDHGGRARLPASLLVLGSCTSLQFGAAIATPLLHSLGPGLTVMFRLLIAAVLLIAVHRPPVHRWKASLWGSAALFGLAMAGMNGFFFTAITRLPLGIAVTIQFLGPLVLSAILAQRRRDVAFVVLAAVGVVALGIPTGARMLDPLGLLAILAAAASWAAYILTGRRLSHHAEGHGSLGIGMGIAAVVVAPFGMTALPQLATSPTAIGPLAAVALLSSFIPYSLEFAALRRLSPPVFGVLLALEPVVAAAAGWLLLGQTLGLLQLVGIVLVVSAAAASSLTNRSNESSSDPTNREPPPTPG